MIRLALFFTFEMSLEKWRQAGILDRELALYRKLADMGVTTTMFTYGGAEDRRMENVPGDDIRVMPLFEDGPCDKWARFFASWRAPLRVRTLLAETDVVKTNQMWGAWSGLIAKYFPGRKWVLRCGFEHHRFLGFQGAGLRDRAFSAILSAAGYRIADRVVFSGESDLDWAVRRFRLRPEDSRLRVIPNYVDTDLFQPSDRGRDPGLILFVGRLETQKNLPLLIEAMPGQGCRLEVVGDGPQRRELEDLAAQRRVEVVFHGHLPQREVAEKMSRAAVFVLPSLYEGMPKALIEAMASGAAVVGADAPGIREFIRDGESGLISDMNPPELRRKIELLLADPALRERLGREGRRRVMDNYSLDRVAELEFRLLSELTGRS